MSTQCCDRVVCDYLLEKVAEEYGICSTSPLSVPTCNSIQLTPEITTAPSGDRWLDRDCNNQYDL